MAGLVPAIRAATFLPRGRAKPERPGVDARDKAGHDALEG